jgi:hypothetical protein
LELFLKELILEERQAGIILAATGVPGSMLFQAKDLKLGT